MGVKIWDIHMEKIVLNLPRGMHKNQCRMDESPNVKAKTNASREKYKTQTCDFGIGKDF